MKKKDQMQKESTMSSIELATKITAVLEKGLSNSQDNRNKDSAEYRLGKMDAYMEVLSVLNVNHK